MGGVGSRSRRGGGRPNWGGTPNSKTMVTTKPCSVRPYTVCFILLFWSLRLRAPRASNSSCSTPETREPRDA